MLIGVGMPQTRRPMVPRWSTSHLVTPDEARRIAAKSKSWVWIIRGPRLNGREDRPTDMLDKSEAPARRWYHAISHAPGPRTQWRIRPHCPDQRITGNNYWQAKAHGIWVRGNLRSAVVSGRPPLANIIVQRRTDFPLVWQARPAN
jgi:hypothetical protein